MEPHACTDPADLLDVVRQVVTDQPNAAEWYHVEAVMKHYHGIVNPVVVVREIRAACARLLPKQLAGHTADCAMEGCESIPSCQLKRPRRSPMVLTLRKQLGIARQALEEIKSDWRPGRKGKSCDPFTVADKALEAIE